MDTRFVPVTVDGIDILVQVAAGPSGEVPVGAVNATVESALAGASATVQKALESVQDLEWSKATIELGVEFALESGTMLAVIGKGSATSALKVSLEFTRSS
ncbi:hypothetical protein SAMN06295909_1379 [Plantibacter sp. VKM Ac-1784]|uniref:Trypsin-co-occurring domain-containing protein n=1 Tax=Plantibacter elymi (nom. nud.) TaxID=199708 RepID=A0ABY1RAR5_9MICO|nr:CU044_2847 family protein [Plantibacter sp. VKM Ac-1784]SMQ66973.1 hypothetical protein SAMN06295909_1379 [Plantibacter sp. VKM Ac-1784]